MTAARAERRTSPRPARESRHRGREAALQMLYQWEVGRMPMPEVQQTFWALGEQRSQVADDMQAFAARLSAGVAASVGDLDPMITNAADNWRLERINVLDWMILRLAVYELVHEADTPARVIINEALELARSFSGDEAVRFVNGVLDAIRRTLQRS